MRLFAGLIAILLGLLLPPQPAHAQLDKVLASVDGALITQRDVSCQLFEARLLDNSLWSIPDEALIPSIVSPMVDEMLLYRHFWDGTREPEALEIKEDTNYVWSEYERLAGSSLALRTLLEQSGLNEDDVLTWLEARARRQWTIEGAVAQRLDPALLSRDDDIATNADAVHLAHIFFAGTDSSGKKDFRKAQEHALNVWVDLSDGFDFTRAAALYSEDPGTARLGGDLGWLDVEVLDPDVRDIVLTLDDDEVSSPVTSSMGVHLFKLLDYRTPRRAALVEAIRDIKTTALRQLRAESDIRLSEGIELKPLPELADPDTSPTVWDELIEKHHEDKEKGPE